MKIPPKYLHTITGYLKKGKYIETIRGKNGGFRIVEPADEISLYDIVTSLEPEKINRCLEADHQCSRKGYGVCAVSRFYELVQETWDTMLKKITLKMLADDPSRETLQEIICQNAAGKEGVQNKWRCRKNGAGRTVFKDDGI